MSAARSMGSHQAAIGKSQVWLTPPEIISALGPDPSLALRGQHSASLHPFDLDPCAAPEPRPWATAARMISLPEDGLHAVWEGFVWCNPPFGPLPVQRAFMQRMASHDNGIALLAARTETKLWFDLVWPRARAILFLQGRPHFHQGDGTRARANSGCPIALIAYGLEATQRLDRAVENGSLRGRVVTP